MSNRHQRRAEVARFRREVQGAHLMTYLVPADISLADSPVVAAALSHWLAGVVSRRHLCIACLAPFAEAEASPGGFLFAISPSVPNAATTSAFCDQLADVAHGARSAVCTRVLRKLLPNGRLEVLGGEVS